jgi:hypothetical protein
MEGQMLNRSQEEMAVFAFLGLLWVGKWTVQKLRAKYDGMFISFPVLLVGWKSFASNAGAGTEDMAIPSRDACLQDGVYCVYEDYYHW